MYRGSTTRYTYLCIIFDLEFGKKTWVDYSSTQITSLSRVDRNYIQAPLGFKKCLTKWTKIRFCYIQINGQKTFTKRLMPICFKKYN
jgi:hypothetical protein